MIQSGVAPVMPQSVRFWICGTPIAFILQLNTPFILPPLLMILRAVAWIVGVLTFPATLIIGMLLGIGEAVRFTSAGAAIGLESIRGASGFTEIICRFLSTALRTELNPIHIGII